MSALCSRNALAALVLACWELSRILPPSQGTLARTTWPSRTSLRSMPDRHRAAGDGLVFTGPEIAENEHVAGRQPDHLAVADIVHEFDAGSGAFHILHQRGRDQGRRCARRNLGCNSQTAARTAATTSVLSAIKWSPCAGKSFSTAFNIVGKDLHSGQEARLQQLTGQNTPVARLPERGAMPASGPEADIAGRHHRRQRRPWRA